MAMQIQIKRSVGVEAPTSLLSGELAFVEGTNSMYIGAGNSGEVRLIKPDFITYATATGSDKIMLEDADGSHKYILDASNITDDITYTLPNSLPDAKSILVCTMVDNKGQLSYGSVEIQKLEDIGDVNFTGASGSNNHILMYDDSVDEWVGKSPTELTDELSLGIATNQTYDNLHLLGSLEVKGDSVQLNGTNLVIRDKLIGVGATHGTLQVTATQNGTTVTIAGSGITDATYFIGEGYTNIPSGHYPISNNDFTSTESITISTPFDLTISQLSTNSEVDNSGLVFPGDTTKSLLWTDENDRFKLVGGDLKVSGEEVYFGEEKVIDSNDNDEKVITGLDINTSQVTGTFDAGDFS